MNYWEIIETIQKLEHNWFVVSWELRFPEVNTIFLESYGIL